MNEFWVEAREQIVEDFISDPYIATEVTIATVAKSLEDLSGHYREEYLESLL